MHVMLVAGGKVASGGSAVSRLPPGDMCGADLLPPAAQDSAIKFRSTNWCVLALLLQPVSQSASQPFGLHDLTGPPARRWECYKRLGMPCRRRFLTGGGPGKLGNSGRGAVGTFCRREQELGERLSVVLAGDNA